MITEGSVIPRLPNVLVREGSNEKRKVKQARGQTPIMPTEVDPGKCLRALCLLAPVGVAGFEPTAPRSQTICAEDSPLTQPN